MTDLVCSATAAPTGEMREALARRFGMTSERHMRHKDFQIGGIFWCGGRQWRCTDIGTRVITAIRLDHVDVESTSPEQRRTLGRVEAEAEGWFNGPPYAVNETVFDEYDIEGCTLEPEAEETATAASSTVAPGSPADDWFSPETLARLKAQAATLREQALAAGLRFEAYLPPRLADWLLAHVERGAFRDPSEAVFVILGEHEELEPQADLRRELLKRSVQAAMDEPEPGIPAEEVFKELRERAKKPLPEPAVWRKRP